MPGNPITIRSLGPEDAWLLDRVRDDVFDNPIEPARAWAFLAARVNLMVVALDRGEVIGFASGTTTLRPDKPTAFYLDEISVHKDYRRRGIATRLLERIADEARDRGCEELWLATEADNDAAVALYHAVGGKATDGIRHFEWDLSLMR